MDYDVYHDVWPPVRCSGPSVFLANCPTVAIGEVYETEGGLDRWWFAWIRPADGTYMCARAHSRAEVLARLAERGGVALRARQP